MKKKDDISKHKVVNKIIDFLLEECSDADRADLKVEIFINVCKFLREWVNCTETMTMEDKTFDTLIKLLGIFDKMSISKFEMLIDAMLQSLRPSGSMYEDNYRSEEGSRTRKQTDSRASQTAGICFIDLISSADPIIKHPLLTHVAIALIDVILKVNVSRDYKALKPRLILLLNKVLKQSNTVWEKCTKFEDKYTGITTIKE